MTDTKWLTALPLLLLAASCSPADDGAGNTATDTAESATLPAGPDTAIGEIALADLPAGIREAALAKIPGMTITKVQRKARDGMVFYDVEGTRPDGSEVELDMLENKNRTYRVVEVQRDIDWADVPANARAAATSNPDMFNPVRVIESVQNDGTVIYELFADGKPSEPSAEISVKDGEAKMLTERWKY